MRKALLMLLGGGLLLGGWGLWAATADSPKEAKNLKPVVVVSLTSYDKMLDNVAMLGTAFGKPELARELIVILKLVAIQQGLAGPDRARPWGAVVQADGDALTGCAFVPSADLAKLAALMEPVVGKAESVGGGVYKIRSRMKPVYVTQKDGWAFFAYNSEALDSSPADPIALLAGLNTQYDAAVRIHAANILPKHRRQFIEWLKNRVDPYANQVQCEPACIYAVRKQATDEMVRPVMAAVNDADTITVGWTLDIAAQKTYMEFGMTAREGTETARSLASVYDVKTQFSGFRLPGAAMVGNWAVPMPSLRIASLDAVVEAIHVLTTENGEKAEEQATVAKQLVADLADLVQANVKSGRVDGGMAVLLKPDAATLLTGGYVADGAKLNSAVKLIAAAAARRNPGVAEWIKLDAAEFQSVHFHTLSIPIPPEAKNREQAVSLIGEKLEMAVGIGRQSVYVAVGREPIAALKQVIEQSAADAPKNVPPVELSLAVGPVARFVAAGCPSQTIRSVAALLAAAVEPAADRDHLRLVASSIPNGVKCRLEVEEGILKLIGRLSATPPGEK